MGPAMNLALAFILTALVLYQGALVPVYEDQPVVVGSIAQGSPASTVDIRPGDRIVSVADRTVDTWEQFYLAVATRPNREISLERGSRRQRIDRQGHAAASAPRADSRSVTSACCRTFIRTCRR